MKLGSSHLSNRYAAFVYSLCLGGSIAAYSAKTCAADLPTPVVQPAAANPNTDTSAASFNGPLATFAAPLARQGITFHVLALDFAYDNVSTGLETGRGANGFYLIEGVDADLSKLWGLSGASLHFENMLLLANENLRHFSSEIADVQVGYQPPYNFRATHLSRATYEQQFLAGKADFEIGVMHPGYLYALPNCSSIDSCFNDILYQNASWTSPLYAVPAANFTYHLSDRVYGEVGTFAAQPDANFHVGYDFPDERYDGVIGMSELGYKTGYDSTPYPGRYSITGFFTTVNHLDYNSNSALTGQSQIISGTQGVVVQGEQVVYRPDGGLAGEKAPTAISVYGSFGAALDSTMPISSDAYMGVTLSAPFAGRPLDTYGLKFNWERLNPNYTQYLDIEKSLAGGNSSPYSRDSFIVEGNAHIQLPLGSAFEPVIQYVINPNPYFAPTSPVKPKDGFYIGGTFIVPLGTLLGLSPS